MTLKSLYNIILKILGLLFIKDLLVAVPTIISMLFYGITGEMLSQVIPLAIAIIIYFLFMYLLLFRTDMLIEKLHLAPEPDVEMISFKMHRATILMIAIIVIAGMVITENLPLFVNNLYDYLSRPRTPFLSNTETYNKSYFILPGVKLFIAVVMLIYQREIIKTIELKRRNLDIEETPEV